MGIIPYQVVVGLKEILEDGKCWLLMGNTEMLVLFLPIISALSRLSIVVYNWLVFHHFKLHRNLDDVSDFQVLINIKARENWDFYKVLNCKEVNVLDHGADSKDHQKTLKTMSDNNCQVWKINQTLALFLGMYNFFFDNGKIILSYSLGHVSLQYVRWFFFLKCYQVQIFLLGWFYIHFNAIYEKI